MGYRLLADCVLIVHTAFIAFVIGGLLLTWIGGLARWRWVHGRVLRSAHLAAIGLVVVQAYLRIPCPLTMWENHLREMAGQEGYPPGGFIAYWLHRAIFFQAEPWVFTLCYSLFGLLVVASLYFVPVHWRKRGDLEARRKKLEPRINTDAHGWD